MSAHTIITMGYASTDNYKLPTLGYSSGAAAQTPAGRLEYTVPASRLEYTVPASRLEFTVTQ